LILCHDTAGNARGYPPDRAKQNAAPVREGIETGLAVLGAHTAGSDTAERKFLASDMRNGIVDAAASGRCFLQKPLPEFLCPRKKQ
jgi:hypothetical protein